MHFFLAYYLKQPNITSLTKISHISVEHFTAVQSFSKTKITIITLFLASVLSLYKLYSSRLTSSFHIFHILPKNINFCKHCIFAVHCHKSLTDTFGMSLILRRFTKSQAMGIYSVCMYMFTNTHSHNRCTGRTHSTFAVAPSSISVFVDKLNK